jgi:hypothetical protein
MTDKAKLAFASLIPLMDNMIKLALELQAVTALSQCDGKWLGFKRTPGRWLYHESAKFRDAANI